MVNQFQTYKCSYVSLFLFKYITAYFLNFAIKLVLLPFEAQPDGTNALNKALPEAHTHLVPAASLCSTCSHFFHETWSCKTRTWDVEADAGELRVPILPSLWLGWALSCPTKPDKGSNLGHRLSLCSVQCVTQAHPLHLGSPQKGSHSPIGLDIPHSADAGPLEYAMQLCRKGTTANLCPAGGSWHSSFCSRWAFLSSPLVPILSGLPSPFVQKQHEKIKCLLFWELL